MIKPEIFIIWASRFDLFLFQNRAQTKNFHKGIKKTVLIYIYSPLFSPIYIGLNSHELYVEKLVHMDQFDKIRPFNQIFLTIKTLSFWIMAVVLVLNFGINALLIG